jgi:hypothetical protein
LAGGLPPGASFRLRLLIVKDVGASPTTLSFAVRLSYSWVEIFLYLFLIDNTEKTMELSLGMDVSRPTKAGSTPTQFHSPDYGGALSSNSRYCR